MQIQITGHGFEVSPALRELTEKKLHRMQRHINNITNIQITFEVDNLTQIAEANVQVPGNSVNARAESNDMYKSVDLLMEKLKVQLTKYKEKTSDH